MDIASLASSLSQMQVSNEISVAVARKTLDAQKQQGDAAIALLEAAKQVGPGASPDGVGAAIDVRA